MANSRLVPVDANTEVNSRLQPITTVNPRLQTVNPATTTPTSRIPQQSLSSTQHQTGQLVDALSSGFDQFMRPIKRTGEIYGQEVRQGLEGMQDEGFLSKAGGALRYGLAALEAPMRGILGEPVAVVATKAAVEMGADPEMAQTGGQLLEDTLTIGGQIASPGTWAKTLFKDAGKVYGPLKFFVDDLSRGSKVQKLEPGSYKPLYEESQADRLIREATERADEVEKSARTAVDETTKGRVPRISLSTQDDVILGVEKRSRKITTIRKDYTNKSPVR